VTQDKLYIYSDFYCAKIVKRQHFFFHRQRFLGIFYWSNFY